MAPLPSGHTAVLLLFFFFRIFWGTQVVLLCILSQHWRTAHCSPLEVPLCILPQSSTWLGLLVPFPTCHFASRAGGHRDPLCPFILVLSVKGCCIQIRASEVPPLSR